MSALTNSKMSQTATTNELDKKEPFPAVYPQLWKSPTKPCIS